ncbi:hypothetical protein C7I55_01140 [Sphingomonas deserti]|uniref:SMP-30/Gluconolactonase/LRE-like region domain-containing protein n=1 Tax=Allosphingosinicella deserti TaxID=2116704 RepID=A0A2P7QYK0_9SPHN|nr:hypothetical protein C7I55_01140 [Sphingomonas deserti]
MLFGRAAINGHYNLGRDHQGWRWSDALDSHGFVTAEPGERVFIANSSENRTYRGLIGEGGRVTDLTVFAERDGESVARQATGNVYIAYGQVFVHAPDGTLTRRIDVPERPLQSLFGGADGRTLFILTHHSLYALVP